MDVVYPLKRDNGGDPELRYSLRSLKNLPHSGVVLSGGRPPWAVDVLHLDHEPAPDKYQDAKWNIIAACESPEVSDPFVLMNDDFFVIRPINEVPVYNRGLSLHVESDYLLRHPNSRYLRGMRETREELERFGYTDILSFALHVPMVVHKQMLLKAIEMGEGLPVWHIRTAYGALAGLKGETIPDVKVHLMYKGLPNREFASTADRTFSQGKIGIQLRNLFRKPGRYESREHD